MSQEALAAEAGIDLSYCSNIETGDANPTVEILERLATAINVEPIEFWRVPAKTEKAPKPLRAGRRRK